MSPTQRELIESLTCKATRGNSIATVGPNAASGFWDFSLACEPHGSVRGRSMRQIAHCRGDDLDFHCRPTGIEIDMPPGDWAHPLYVVDTTPEHGLELYDFIEQRAHENREISPKELAGYISILWVEGNGWYLVTIEFTDLELWYHVIERCGPRACKRKLKYDATYPLLDME